MIIFVKKNFMFNVNNMGMKMKNISYGLLAGLLLGACSGGVYEETGNGVIVKVQQKEDRGARLVRLQVGNSR